MDQYVFLTPEQLQQIDGQYAAYEGNYNLLKQRLFSMPQNDPQYAYLNQQVNQYKTMMDQLNSQKTAWTNTQNYVNQMYSTDPMGLQSWATQNNFNNDQITAALGKAPVYQPVQPQQPAQGGTGQPQAPVQTFRTGDNFKGAGMFTQPATPYKTLFQQGVQQAQGAPVMAKAPTLTQQQTGLFSQGN
jgi:hypothetical protein